MTELPKAVHLPIQRPTVGDVQAWLSQERAAFDELLATHGALLFPRVQVTKPEDLQQLATELDPQLMRYVGGNSPRKVVSDHVYTSTELPPAQVISLHNEMSYAHEAPRFLVFQCIVPATRGGATPLGDSRRVLARMDRHLVERLDARGVMYVRNLSGNRGLGKPWQETFETQDRHEVELVLRRDGAEHRWTDSGGLVYRTVCKAFQVHPTSGERVWFNQVEQWHPSYIDAAMRKALAKQLKEPEFPRYACYGDGSPFNESDLQEIRRVYEEVGVPVAWEAGDLVIVDNFLVMHGRASFEGPRRVLVAMAGSVAV